MISTQCKKFNQARVNGRSNYDNLTILIPKKSTPKAINYYWPLTIGAHLSRFFTRTQAGRLTHQLPLHLRKKAFRPVNGCGKNLPLLKGIIADAMKRKAPLYITFVDVAKAFDTVSHNLIVQGHLYRL